MSSCITAPIAIIGVACRLPGDVDSLDSLWPILANGRDAVTSIPAGRWDTARFLHPRRSMPGHTVSVRAGVIENIYAFDPVFFGISRKEAEVMDPQQRLLLELTWEALENASIPPSSLAGSDTAVFVGAASPDAGTRHADDICATSPYSMTGTNLSIIANRISYIFDFHGPSLTIDTACSSAMYALHQACQALAAGGAGMALAGGANVLLAPYPFVGFSQAHMLSPDGCCKVFDASGNGYVRAEGGGVLLLQPLDAALAQGRHIHAVIRGVACNSDGRTQGIALPSALAQERLLREVYEAASCRPDQLTYLEAHGTGTAAGDPVETAAIGHALGMQRAAPLVIGSVKCNLGHLETASAMAGIMKSLLVLREGRIPPQIHITRLNPAIDLKGLNLRVPLRMIRMPRVSGRPLVGVNSFGFGGANGHLLLEAAPDTPHRVRRIHAVPPLFLSARSEVSLRALAGKYAQRIQEQKNVYYDLAAGTALTREVMPCRLVVNADSAEDNIAVLRAFATSREKTGSRLNQGEAIRTDAHLRAGRPLTAFVFSGNGGQWAGMGKALLADAAFASQARKIANLMLPLSGVDLVELLRTATPLDMERTEVAQQLLFLVQAGLCAALAQTGMTADAVFGHSVGEVAAAWYSGALSLKDAVKVIYYRSLYQGQTHGLGRMAAASVSLEEAEHLAAQYGDVEIAGVNAADAVTLSGSSESLARIGEELQRRRIFFKMLPLEYAFHSSRMDGVKAELLHSLKGLRGRVTRIPFISTVTGGLMRRACIAAYWWRNVRQPVDFQRATQTALDMGVRFFLEIGPHSILLRYLRSGLKQTRLNDGNGVDGWAGGTLTRDGDCLSQFHASWRAAWVHGWPLDMRRHFPVPGRHMSLPSYPWNREDCQIAPTPECAGYIKARAEHPLLGWRTAGAHLWENVLDLENSPWIGDHKVGKSVYYPAAAFLEMALAAARLAGNGNGPVAMLHTTIFRPMLFHERQPMKLRTMVDATDGEVRILARPHMQDEQWVLHAKGRMVRLDALSPPPCAVALKPEGFGEEMPRQELYRLTTMANMAYGPVFRPVERLWRKGDSILARFAPTSSASGAKDMLIPPPLLDGGLQLLFPLIAGLLEKNPAPRLPYWFERCTLFQPGHPVFALARLERASRRNVVCDVSLLDAHGHVLLQLQGGHARTVEHLAAATTAVYATHAVPQPHPLSGLPDKTPSVAELREALDARATALTARPDWQKRHNEILPLREMAALALARDLTDMSALQLQPAPACPPHLASYLRERLAARGTEFKDSLPSFEAIWRTLMADAPDDVAANLLLSNAHKALLSGEPATPPDSPLWEGYFRRETHLTTDLLCHALERILAARPHGEALHVLEAGAAPGVVSRAISPLLHGQIRTITDKDASALERLRLALGTRSAEHPGEEHVDFSSWDLEEGSMPARKAHILVAAYCMREADSIVPALQRCREALHPGGYFLLAEQAPDLTENLLFGQQADWWNASPATDQPISRLLSPEAWRSATKQAGFEDIILLHPGDGHAQENSFLLLARAAYAVPQKAMPEPPAKETWLLLEDTAPSPLAQSLLEELERRLSLAEAALVRVRAADTLHLRGQAWRLCPDKAAHWRALWQRLSAVGRPIVCINTLGLTAQDLALESVRKQCDALVQLVRGWDFAGRPQACLRLLTTGALDHPDATTCLAPAQACAVGAARVLMNEMPALETRCIDLHVSEKGDNADLLESCLRELLHPMTEREVILDGRRRYVLRSLEMKHSRTTDVGDGALRLHCESPGRLESLRWRPVLRPQASPGMVVVAVKAVGLNFRDVMWAMNLLPEEALENGFSGPGLGIECAGVVESVGRGVDSVRPGQHVVCFAPHCFSTHVLTTASAVARIPDQWSFAEAATVPVTFFTAWYALHHLAGLQPGESVLIHGAAGGVGLAALQIATGMQLEIFATAGSGEKRHMLRLLGVSHVYDSRSLAFHDQILADTRGEGVDAVLNSLAGDGMDQSLRILKPFGRFLELGKRDFYADSPLRLRPFRNNISYFGIDVDQLMKTRPALGQRLFLEMMQHFNDGSWRPLPFDMYPGAEVEAAFRTMQQSRHVGKVVIEPPQANPVPPPPQPLSMPVRPDGSYLVSGGLSGFGLATALRLAQRGAGALVLLSRKGATPDNAAILQRLRTEGLPEGRLRPVIALAQDVADDALPAALDAALHDLPPLRGVVHAAAVLDDAVLTRLTPQRLARVLRPKVGGAFNLHAYSLGRELDFFIMYSSATTLLGNPGQANYVAANMALESLAALRRRMGLPGLAVGWGAIGDAGMLTRNASALESLKRVTGIAPMQAQDALMALERLPADTPPAPALFTADWKRLARLPLGQSPRFDLLRPESDVQEATGLSLRERIKDKSENDALACVTEAITAAVARILRVAASSLRPGTPLADMGMDSLMAMELGLALEEMLDGFTLSGGLSAGTSIRDLSARAYAILSGSSGLDDMRRAMEASHGITVGDEMADAALQAGRRKGHE